MDLEADRKNARVILEHAKKHIDSQRVAALFEGVGLNPHSPIFFRGGHNRIGLKPSGGEEGIYRVETSFTKEQLPYVLASSNVLAALADGGASETLTGRIRAKHLLNMNDPNASHHFQSAVISGVCGVIDEFYEPFAGLIPALRADLSSAGFSGMALAVSFATHYLDYAITGGAYPNDEVPYEDLGTVPADRFISNDSKRGSQVWCLGKSFGERITAHSWEAAKQLAQAPEVLRHHQLYLDKLKSYYSRPRSTPFPYEYDEWFTVMGRFIEHTKEKLGLIVN